jgi:hypothetical protein
VPAQRAGYYMDGPGGKMVTIGLAARKAIRGIVDSLSLTLRLQPGVGARLEDGRTALAVCGG